MKYLNAISQVAIVVEQVAAAAQRVLAVVEQLREKR
jgi:hypothetical protein